MANEINGVAGWIEARLKTSSVITGGVGQHPRLKIAQIYEMIAPAGATTPYIVYAYKAGRDINGTGAYRAAAILRYDVKVIVQGDSFASQIPKNADGTDKVGAAAVNTASIADEIDRLLHQGQDMVDPIVIGAQSIAKIQYSEIVGNVRLNHIGSVIEVMAYYQ